MRWALSQEGVGTGAKLVLLCLASKWKGCPPTENEIARICEMSRTSVRLHLGRLELRGLVRRRPRVDQVTGRRSRVEYVLEFGSAR